MIFKEGELDEFLVSAKNAHTKNYGRKDVVRLMGRAIGMQEKVFQSIDINIFPGFSLCLE